MFYVKNPCADRSNMYILLMAMNHTTPFSNPTYSKRFKGYLPLGYDYKSGEKGTMGFSKKCTKGYRYNFNGKELDDEGLGGGGSTYDYGFRIYNANLGRFLSVDPLFRSYPDLTPYQFASNMPIKFIDLDGLEAAEATTNTGNTKIETQDNLKVEKTNTFTCVLSLGIQGGVEIKLFGGSFSLFGNLGSIDLIGVRDGKFVFFKGSRREVKIEAGPLTIASWDQERTYIQDENFNKTTTTVTTGTVGFGQAEQGKEKTEVEFSEKGQNNSQKVSETVKTVGKKSFGFKVGFGVAFELSKDEKILEWREKQPNSPANQNKSNTNTEVPDTQVPPEPKNKSEDEN